MELTGRALQGRILPWLDRLKEQLVDPEGAESHLAENGCSEYPGHVAWAYRLYEDELRRANALDSQSLILEAYRLFASPALARHYPTSHWHWLIDSSRTSAERGTGFVLPHGGREFPRHLRGRRRRADDAGRGWRALAPDRGRHAAFRLQGSSIGWWRGRTRVGRRP